ncbi:MAG: endonuclease/exonuclease/phosphatase family protein [Deltaproteobacteria bacterium]|nr:endonuclease/exonuclease/phosphatase family protein [Deltaproteobacteria bacterium]
MRRLLSIAFPVFALLTADCGDGGEMPIQARVMTFNVLCSFCSSDYDPWDERLGYFEDILTRHDPDLVGLQEIAFPEEVDQFLALREGFAAVYYQGSEPGPLGLTDYPDATVLFRQDRFELVDHGFYWLSPTPDEPWSAGFATGGQLPRLVTWTRLLELASEREIAFITTHFDNNTPSQERSAPLLLERTADLADVPIIVTGDFNSQPTDPAYSTLVQGVDGLAFGNTFDMVEPFELLANRDPAPAYEPEARIDHIFVAGPAEFTCSEWSADVYLYGPLERFPSDHRALSAEIAF